LLALLWAATAQAQLASPGDLAKPHASLEGLSHCSKCHTEGDQLSAGKCLSCHSELRARVDKRRGLHGKMADEKRNKCEECHHEHQGRDAQLVEALDRFDHSRVGWPLRGKHTGQKCANCHEAKRIVDNDAAALFKKSQSTYLGLTQKCTSCHFDEHRGQLDAGCEKCHGESDWKPQRFDHKDTSFPLAGKHKSVACAKCHPSVKDEESHAAFPVPRAPSFMKLQPISHNHCNACHADPHQGRFTGTCESCHSVEGWHSIKNTAEEKKFHDKTRFPLRGAHTAVGCAACHGPFPGRPAKFRGLPHDQCMDCHLDAHHGQIAKPACERCHTIDGFRPARFELEQHQETRFALQGAHAAVPCSSCHKADPKLARAAATAPAKKKGRAVKNARTEQPVSPIAFRVAGKLDRCETCHADPHAGQLGNDCSKCHTSTSFNELQFNHQDTRFPLDGKHAQVACGTCHRGKPVKYKPMALACSGCHSDVHQGQLGGECARCHDTGGWNRTRFNHNDTRFTSFALEGKHGKLACGRCHLPVELGPGKKVARYKGLPRQCEGCHSDAHHGEFRGFEP
jgi:hypothetical protein